MSDALVNAFTVLFIIFLSCFLKRVKLLNIEAAKSMSYVVMYVTLPCTILSSANGISFDVSLTLVLVISFLVNVILIAIGFFTQKTERMRIFTMINVAGFNIGNFVIPFMASIISPKAFLALCMFDLINALFVFGGTYSMALFFNRSSTDANPVTLKSILKEMSKSAPFYSYFIAILLSSLSLSIPDKLLIPLEILGGANTFLCMMIIGIAINFRVSFDQVKKLLQMVLIRYISCISLLAIIFFVVPLPTEIKIIIMVIMLAPMPSLAPILTMKATPELSEDSANLNTISIMISIVLVTCFNSIMPLLYALDA